MIDIIIAPSIFMIHDIQETQPIWILPFLSLHGKEDFWLVNSLMRYTKVSRGPINWVELAGSNEIEEAIKSNFAKLYELWRNMLSLIYTKIKFT